MYALMNSLSQVPKFWLLTGLVFSALLLVRWSVGAVVTAVSGHPMPWRIRYLIFAFVVAAAMPELVVYVFLFFFAIWGTLLALAAVACWLWTRRFMRTPVRRLWPVAAAAAVAYAVPWSVVGASMMPVVGPAVRPLVEPVVYRARAYFLAKNEREAQQLQLSQLEFKQRQGLMPFLKGDIILPGGIDATIEGRRGEYVKVTEWYHGPTAINSENIIAALRALHEYGGGNVEVWLMTGNLARQGRTHPQYNDPEKRMAEVRYWAKFIHCGYIRAVHDFNGKDITDELRTGDYQRTPLCPHKQT